MADLYDKQTGEILLGVNAPDYDARYTKREQLPDDSRYAVVSFDLLDITPVRDVEPKFRKWDKGGPVPMTQAEQDAIRATEKAAMIDAQVAALDKDVIAAIVAGTGKTADDAVAAYRATLEAKADGQR